MSRFCKANPFDEDSLLSPPKPIFSSSMASTGSHTFDFDDIPQRLSEANSSLGILSLKSSVSPRSSLNLNSHLQEQRSLALYALDRASIQAGSNNNARIPSRLLKPSEITDTNVHSMNTESTISESDLTPQTSTPSKSSNTFDLNQMRDRHSVSQSMARLSEISKTANMEDLMKNFHEFANPKTPSYSFGSDVFSPAAEMEQQFLDDEVNWKSENRFPADCKDFSINSFKLKESTLSEYFRARSEDCSNLVTESSHNLDEPIALIEQSTVAPDQTTTSTSIQISKAEKDSLSLSNIQRILSDSNQTPVRALEMFLNPKKEKHTKKSPQKDQDGFVKPQGVPPRSKISTPISRKSLPLNFSTNSSAQDEFKENIEFMKNSRENKSVSSSRSSSALSNLLEGKLPIETTRSELIWGCIRIGKSSSLEFIIRNKSSSRIKFELVVSNPAFKVICENGDPHYPGNARLILHSFESKKVTVTFSPGKIGAAVCKLNFQAINTNQLQKQFIKLYGYGGAGSLAIKGVSREPTGRFLLSLGSLDTANTINKSFVLKNEGVLPVFAILRFNTQGFYHFPTIKVTPERVIIMPQQDVKVVVTYYPSSEDLNYIKSKVNFSFADIGHLTLIHGNEVDRGRLRRVCGIKNAGTPEKAISLIDIFPGEIMPSDLREFKESSTALNDILKLFHTKEVLLYFEHDLEKTMMANFQDESVLFQSLYEQNSDLANTTLCADGFTVEPSKILLTPPTKNSDVILLSNNNKKRVCFAVQVESQDLTVFPLDGCLNPGENMMITIKLDNNSDRNGFVIKVVIESEVYEVSVKVLHLK